MKKTTKSRALKINLEIKSVFWQSTQLGFVVWNESLLVLGSHKKKSTVGWMWLRSL